jgi:PII-like signaling protein
VSGGAKRDEMAQMRFRFGERDRCGDGPLDAAVMDACVRHGMRAAVLLRGVEGFGGKHRLRTDRLLTLSEDAPLVAVAVGETEVVEALAEEVRGMAGGGLVLVEGIYGARTTGTTTSPAEQVVVPVVGAPEDEGGGSGRAAKDSAGGAPGEAEGRAPSDAEGHAPGHRGDIVKVTIWGPRGGSGSPHVAAVAALHRHGAMAATVLLGVDGVLEGDRRRARFVAGNRGVPAMTVAVGDRAAIGNALAELDVAPNLVTVEAVETYRRLEAVSLHGDGGVEPKWPIEPPSLPGRPAGRVTLLTSEIASGGPHPRYVELIHALRREGAAGATALRGVWGFRGDEEPHGDRVLALRRNVPIVVETVDTVERAAEWRELAHSLAGDEDLVYSQVIPRIFTLE